MIFISRLLEFTRGGEVTTMTGNISLYKNAPRVQIYNPDTSGRIVTLPDFSILPKGGPHFYIVNISNVNSFDVRSFNNEESFIVATQKALVMSTFRNVGNAAWLGSIRDFLGTAIGAV